MGRDPCGVYSVSSFFFFFIFYFFYFFIFFFLFIFYLFFIFFIFLFLLLLLFFFYFFIFFLLGIGVGHLWHFSAFVVFMRDARWSFYFIHSFIYFCVALRLAFTGMGHWGGTLVAFTGLVGFYWALGLDVCGAFQRL